MTTRIVKINENEPEKDIIKDAAAILKEGGLVAFPTETVYGLGADALLPEGAKRIYAAKGRPSDNPLIVHIADFEALDKIARNVPPQARALAEAFWPGPLTMIFQKTDAVPYETTGGLDTVAVRMPSHPVALALIRESGGYIAAPSANTSGKPSPTKAGHVALDLDGRIPLILDGGAVDIGIESTIIDLSCLGNEKEAAQDESGTKSVSGKSQLCKEEGTCRDKNTADLPDDLNRVPMILRPGCITKEMISSVIGAVRDDPGLIQEDANVRPKAPGMKYKHYAPKADLILVNGRKEDVTRRMNELADESRAKGEKVGIICTEETAGLYQADVVKNIGSRQDEDSIAKHLYEILREFDDLDVDKIYSESLSTPRLGQAIMNRLLKAAGHQVIEV